MRLAGSCGKNLKTELRAPDSSKLEQVAGHMAHPLTPQTLFRFLYSTTDNLIQRHTIRKKYIIE